MVKYTHLVPLILVFTVAPVAMGLVGSLNLPKLCALSKEGKTVTATVVKYEPENHSSVFYEYSVGGRTYSGRDSATPAPTVGKHISATYLPSDPAVSIGGDQPKTRLQNELTVIAIGAILFPTVLICRFYAKLGKHSEQPLRMPATSTNIGPAALRARHAFSKIRLTKR